jgi:hypothetical protein
LFQSPRNTVTPPHLLGDRSTAGRAAPHPVGCGDKALEAFQAADNPLDTEFVTELERIIQRSRDELAVLVEHMRAAD